MFAVKAQITRCLDDTNYPALVECQFVDAHGAVHTFEDKDVIFSTHSLDMESSYPLNGVVGCEIIGKIIEGDRQLIEVNTNSPWGIVSTQGETVFEVREEQLLEFEHSI